MDPSEFEPWQKVKEQYNWPDAWLTGPLPEGCEECGCHAALREVRAEWQQMVEPRKCEKCKRVMCSHTVMEHAQSYWVCDGCPTGGACGRRRLADKPEAKPETQRKEGKSALMASLKIRIVEKQGLKNRSIKRALVSQLHNLADGLNAIPDAELLNLKFPFSVDGEPAGEWRVDRLAEGEESYTDKRIKAMEKRIDSDRTWLVSCPWCGETMNGREISSQMSHLITCGDQRIAEAEMEGECKGQQRKAEEGYR